MTMPPDFDPSAGDPLGDMHGAVFPDAAKLIAETEEEMGPSDAGYRVARVPNTHVYILYGIDEASHTVRIVSIRTHEGSVN